MSIHLLILNVVFGCLHATIQYMVTEFMDVRGRLFKSWSVNSINKGCFSVKAFSQIVLQYRCVYFMNQLYCFVVLCCELLMMVGCVLDSKLQLVFIQFCKLPHASVCFQFFSGFGFKFGSFSLIMPMCSCLENFEQGNINLWVVTLFYLPNTLC